MLTRRMADSAATPRSSITTTAPTTYHSPYSKHYSFSESKKKKKSRINPIPPDDVKQVTYFPAIAGDYVVDVKLKDKPIKDSPFVVGVQGPAAFSVLSGPSTPPITSFRVIVRLISYSEHLRLGQPAEYKVEGRDAEGKPTARGGDNIVAEVSDDAGKALPEDAVAVTDTGNGTYVIRPRLIAPGRYRLNVSVNGKPSEGSPFNFTVRFPLFYFFIPLRMLARICLSFPTCSVFPSDCLARWARQARRRPRQTDRESRPKSSWARRASSKFTSGTTRGNPALTWLTWSRSRSRGSSFFFFVFRSASRRRVGS